MPAGAGGGGLLADATPAGTAAEEGWNLAGFVLAGVAGERTVEGVRRKGPRWLVTGGKVLSGRAGAAYLRIGS